MMKQVVIVYGGDLANDVAERIAAEKPDIDVEVSLRNASEKPKTLLEFDQDTVVCFVIQTIENAAPTEDGGACMRFFKRRTHPEDLLQGKFSYSVLGLGDSNLLMDRQTTTAKDCNQCAVQLNSRLEALGGTCFHELGQADERTGLTEVESYIKSFWASFQTI